jgi:hypothetical protein
MTQGKQNYKQKQQQTCGQKTTSSPELSHYFKYLVFNIEQ